MGNMSYDTALKFWSGLSGIIDIRNLQYYCSESGNFDHKFHFTVKSRGGEREGHIFIKHRTLITLTTSLHMLCYFERKNVQYAAPPFFYNHVRIDKATFYAQYFVRRTVQSS